ncbi:MAG: hypothetical protein RLZZ362_2561 [Actinomycetota bacterium]|jgi:SAM-dependent methyltransferase
MCGAAALTVERAIHTLQGDPEVVLMSCGRCRATSVSRLPTSTALDDYYGSYYDDARVDAVTTDDPARIARRIASYAAGNSDVDLLDFGGGDGSIGVEVLKRLGVGGSVTVVDYDHRRSATTPAGVRLTHASELGDVEGTFDLVVASAVIEHLPHPSVALQDLLAKVSIGGVFYARTPFVVPVTRAAGRVGVHIDFTFPAHLFDLGPDFWGGLTSWIPSFGDFDVIASRPSPVETGLRSHPTRTVASTLMKLPWWVLRERWPFVGGWELAARRVR